MNNRLGPLLVLLGGLLLLADTSGLPAELLSLLDRLLTP